MIPNALHKTKLVSNGQNNIKRRVTRNKNIKIFFAKKGLNILEVLKMVQNYPPSTYWLQNALLIHVSAPKYSCHPPLGSKLTTYLTVLKLNSLNIF